MRSLLLAAAFLATLSFACGTDGTATSPGGPDQTSTPPTESKAAAPDDAADAADAAVPHDVESDGGPEDASIDGGPGTLCGSGVISPADSQMACETAAPPLFMDPSACSGAFTYTSGTWEARCFADGSAAIEATFVGAAGYAYMCFYEAGSHSGACVLDADGTDYAPPPTSSPDLVLRSFVQAPSNPASKVTSATLLVTGPTAAAPGAMPKLRFIGGASLSWH